MSKVWMALGRVGRTIEVRVANGVVRFFQWHRFKLVWGPYIVRTQQK